LGRKRRAADLATAQHDRLIEYAGVVWIRPEQAVQHAWDEGERDQRESQDSTTEDEAHVTTATIITSSRIRSHWRPAANPAKQ
jgi:hypothetical protein